MRELSASPKSGLKSLLKRACLLSLPGINNFEVCLMLTSAFRLCKKLNAAGQLSPEIKVERLFRLAVLRAALYDNDFETLFTKLTTKVVSDRATLSAVWAVSPEKVKKPGIIMAVNNHLDNTLFTGQNFII
ncbi:hypothetical protein FHW88_001491 [Mucilaginibacter sp. SG538B]|uniref:hypothetical protein n=1 Tax=Mucilaginibacter sp. SG538B TaxID=2587021 RepID=UPI00159D0935|nr:hypothetical protein [Mucilaginibacter sp. SG538B]NVM63215.1 hypothetical protein [Mucilaginibacter sp. SG538B]